MAGAAADGGQGREEALLEPDRVEAETFVEALTGSPHSEVTFQTFDDADRERKSLVRVLQGSVADCWRELVRLNRQGAGIFIQVNAGAGRGKARITGLRSLFIDDDSGQVTLAAVGLTPSVVVRSKAGLHVYWRLRSGEHLEAFAPAQVALADAYPGADRSVKNLDRVMRLPGTLHMKNPRGPFLVRVVQVDPAIYSVTEVIEGNGARLAPSVAPARSTIATGSGDSMRRAQAWIAKRDNAAQGQRNVAAFATAAGVRDFGLSGEEALDLLRPWNRRNDPPLEEAELAAAVAHAYKYATGAPGAKPDRPRTNGATRREQAAAVSTAEDLEDLRTARRLVERAAGRFLFLVRRGGGDWHRWDGLRWARDDGRGVYELAAEVARSFVLEAADAAGDRQKDLFRQGRRAAQAAHLAAAVQLAATAFPDLKAPASDFDTDDFALNTPSGLVDLRTGEARPSRPADRVTRLGGVPYDPEARSARWERFLAEVLPSADLRAYVRRAAGHSLTGSTREHALFLLVGRQGRNGKGVFMRLLRAAFGDYASTATPGLLLDRRGSEPHLTELAALEGARFVYGSEVAPRARWNEPRLKALTGGDPLRANYMRQDTFEFMPRCKLWLAVNERPHVAGNTEAIWSRLKEIRFPVHFRDADDTRPEAAADPVRDPGLEAELLATALPAVLAWAVAGCLEWQRQGLGEPPEVRQAVREYQAAEDRLEPFIAEHPVSASVRLRDLYRAWSSWCSEAGEQPGPQAEFSAALRAKGYDVRKSHGAYTVFPLEVPLPGSGGWSGRPAKADSEVVNHGRARDPLLSETGLPEVYRSTRGEGS